VAGGRHGEAALMGADTWLFWALRGNALEGLRWLEQLDETGLSPVERTALHLTRGGLRFASGDVAATASIAEAALPLAEAAGNAEFHADALVLAALAAVFTGRLERAAELLDRAEVVGDLWACAMAATCRGQLAWATGDVAAADAALVRAERLSRELGSPFTLATLLNVRASLALSLDDDEAAYGFWAEAAELAAEVRTTWTLAYTLPGLAVVAARRGLPELAAELFAAGSATAEAASVAVSYPPDLAFTAEALSAVRAELGEEAFGRAWERGRGVRPADVPRLAERISARPAPG
jgi:hypothetical protein